MDLVDKRRRTARRTIDRESKYVKAVVIADDIMELLRFDALREIDVGIEDTFIPAERVSHGCAGRIEHHRDPSG
jgi:hypothetical protein